MVYVLPGWIKWGLVALTVATVISLSINVLTVIYAVDVNRQLNETADYISGKGEQRDRENAELQEDIRRAVCSLLDSLPEGALLAPQREQYGCGPGIPVEELGPEASQNLADILGEVEDAQPAETAPASPVPARPTSAPDEMPPGAPAGAQPSPMGTPPATTTAPVPPAPTAAPTTTAPPLVDLSTVTDEVCALLGVCL